MLYCGPKLIEWKILNLIKFIKQTRLFFECMERRESSFVTLLLVNPSFRLKKYIVSFFFFLNTTVSFIATNTIVVNSTFPFFFFLSNRMFLNKQFSVPNISLHHRGCSIFTSAPVNPCPLSFSSEQRRQTAADV